MPIDSISAAGLNQSVLASSDSTQLRQGLQALQNSLALGDLNGAQSAFQTVQDLNQNLETASGSSQSSNSQLSTDLAALGGTLRSGDLSNAQAAFAAVQSDLKNAASLAQAVERNAAAQSVQLVNELLSSLNSNSPSSETSDSTTAVLERVYGHGSLNIFG